MGVNRTSCARTVNASAEGQACVEPYLPILKESVRWIYAQQPPGGGAHANGCSVSPGSSSGSSVDNKNPLRRKARCMTLQSYIKFHSLRFFMIGALLFGLTAFVGIPSTYAQSCDVYVDASAFRNGNGAKGNPYPTLGFVEGAGTSDDPTQYRYDTTGPTPSGFDRLIRTGRHPGVSQSPSR